MRKGYWTHLNILSIAQNQFADFETIPDLFINSKNEKEAELRIEYNEKECQTMNWVYKMETKTMKEIDVSGFIKINLKMLSNRFEGCRFNEEEEILI